MDVKSNYKTIGAAKRKLIIRLQLNRNGIERYSIQEYILNPLGMPPRESQKGDDRDKEGKNLPCVQMFCFESKFFKAG